MTITCDSNISCFDVISKTQIISSHKNKLLKLWDVSK